MPAACSVCVQRAAVTSGEVYHSSLKNMQVVTLDTRIIFYVRLASLIFFEPIQATTCQ